MDTCFLSLIVLSYIQKQVLLDGTMRIIDLTQKIYEGMNVYPGDPEVKITEECTLAKDGYTVFKIQINDQIGTHIETQYHMLQGKRLVDEHISRFIGIAHVIDVPCRKITKDDLQQSGDSLKSCEFLLLRSRYSQTRKNINVNDINRPVLGIEAIKWIVEQGIRLIGIDCFDFDEPPHYPGHKYLLKHNVLIVEGLTNLGSLVKKRIKLFVIPLKIERTGASPCRAFAIEE